MGDDRNLAALGAVRETRPADELTQIHLYDLPAPFKISDVPTTRPVVASANLESFRLVAPPLVTQPMHRDATAQTTASVPTPASEARSQMASLAIAPASHVDTRTDDHARPTASSTPPVADVALPYGFDSARVRDLVDGFVDVRAATAAVLVPRAAGDLTDVPNDGPELEGRLRRVAASERLPA